MTTQTLKVLAFLTFMFTTAMSQAQIEPPGQGTAAELSEAKIQSCITRCGETLARCERARARGLHCTRESQQCKENCTASKRQPLSPKEKRLRICAQRCENSGALCEQSEQQNVEQCSRGTAACLKRCD